MTLLLLMFGLGTLASCSLATLWVEGADRQALSSLSFSQHSSLFSVTLADSSTAPENKILKQSENVQKAFIEKLKTAGASCSTTASRYIKTAMLNGKEIILEDEVKPDNGITECIALSCRGEGFFLRWRFLHKQGKTIISSSNLPDLRCTKKNISLLQETLSKANTGEINTVKTKVETEKL